MRLQAFRVFVILALLPFVYEPNPQARALVLIVLLLLVGDVLGKVN